MCYSICMLYVSIIVWMSVHRDFKPILYNLVARWLALLPCSTDNQGSNLTMCV